MKEIVVKKTFPSETKTKINNKKQNKSKQKQNKENEKENETKSKPKQLKIDPTSHKWKSARVYRFRDIQFVVKTEILLCVIFFSTC